jgi:preprotein translocase subunit SecD
MGGEGQSMKRLFALMALPAAALAQGATTKPVTLSVHLLLACSGVATVKVKVAGGTECLDPKPFLTQQDVQSAELQKNSKGNPVIFLTFHNDAAIRELQVTRGNIGRPVAIVLNGRVVSAPVVAAASRYLYIAADFKQDQAAALAADLNRQAGNH